MLKPPKDESGLRRASMLMTIPTLLLAGPLVGFFLGRLLDGRFKTDPWFQFGGVVLGFVAAVQQIIAIIRRVQAEGEDAKRR